MKVSKRQMKNAMGGIKSTSGRPFIAPNNVKKIKSKAISEAIGINYENLAASLMDANKNHRLAYAVVGYNQG